MRAISWYIVLLYAVIYYKNTWCQWDQLSKAFSQPCRGHHESESLNVCNSFIMRMKTSCGEISFTNTAHYASVSARSLKDDGTWHIWFLHRDIVPLLFPVALCFPAWTGPWGSPLNNPEANTPDTHIHREREKNKPWSSFLDNILPAQNKNRCVHIDGNGAKDLIISQG